jgi:excinuclease ABC subunit A
LRLLYAHIGQPYCPETGVPIVTQTTSDIVDKILALASARPRDDPRAGRA